MMMVKTNAVTGHYIIFVLQEWVDYFCVTGMSGFDIKIENEGAEEPEIVTQKPWVLFSDPLIHSSSSLPLPSIALEPDIHSIKIE